jgi:phage shock protein PspC (stress-responsive transcriptional regulator)
MKRTLTLNIGGVVFHVDEDAYLLLKSYLDSLSEYFKEEPDGDEILRDIETRVAELLRQQAPDEAMVITVAHINFAIETLGRPEDFSEKQDEKQSETGEEKRNFSASSKNKRKFYRDPHNKTIAGICSGLAAYFDIDIILVRVIFIVLFFVTAGQISFVYIILWIFIPEAVTAAQRLEMQGEPVTVNNINKEFNDLKNNAKKQYDKFQEKMRNNSSKNAPPRPPRPPRRSSGAGNAITMFFKIIASIIGSVFIVLFLLVLFGLVALLLGASFPETFFNIADLNLNGIIDHDFARSSAGLSLGLILILATPLFLLIYFVSKLAFGHQGKTGWVLLFAFGLWIAGFIIGGKSLLNMVQNDEIPKAWFNNININYNDTFTTTSRHISLDADTLFIDFGACDSILNLRKENDIYIGNNGKKYVKPGIKIYTIEDFNNMNIKTTVPSFNTDEKNIIIPYKFEGDTLYLPPLVEITNSYSGNKPLTLTIKIPTQKHVAFLDSQGNENLKSVVFARESYPLSTLPQHVWFTTDDGLIISK